MWFSRDFVHALSTRDPGNADLMAEVVQRRTAWPWLCDQLGHVNNARYFDLLQDGRVAWMLRNGLLRPLVRRRMSFLVAGVGGVYRQPIPLMAEFVLRTRFAAFDARWLYFEQTFFCSRAEPRASTTLTPEPKVAARFLMRVMMRAPKGPLSPHESLRALGATLPEQPPAPPPDLESWAGAQEACLAQMREPGGTT
jgi:acyl-CoA thioesterase FadM